MGSIATIYSATPADIPAAPAPPSGTDDLLRYSDERGEVLDAIDKLPSLCLDKAWQAVAFALGDRQGDDPLAFLEYGGDAVDALEYGRYFGPEAVRAIHAAVYGLSDDDLARNFARRDELDPDDASTLWLLPYEIEDVVDYVKDLRRFLTGVAKEKRGIVVLIVF